MSAWMTGTHPRLDSAPPPKYPTKTVEVECIVPAGQPSFMIGAVPQVAGDRIRVGLHVALDLVAVRKARIVPDSEKTEML